MKGHTKEIQASGLSMPVKACVNSSGKVHAAGMLTLRAPKNSCSFSPKCHLALSPEALQSDTAQCQQASLVRSKRC